MKHLLSLILILLACSNSKAQSLKYERADLASAQLEAKQEGRPLCVLRSLI